MAANIWANRPIFVLPLLLLPFGVSYGSSQNRNFQVVKKKQTDILLATCLLSRFRGIISQCYSKQATEMTKYIHVVTADLRLVTTCSGVQAHLHTKPEQDYLQNCNAISISL